MITFDSNVWIAFLHGSDSQHQKAQKIFASQKEPVAITEYVIIEVSSVLLQKAGQKTADGFLDLVMNNKDVEVIYAQDQFFNEVVSFFRESATKQLSFIDMSLLHASKLYEIVTFDKNLQKAMRGK